MVRFPGPGQENFPTKHTWGKKNLLKKPQPREKFLPTFSNRNFNLLRKRLQTALMNIFKSTE